MDPSAVGGSPVELLYRRTGGGQEAANESALTQQLGVATDRVSLLENLTQLLDQDGTYYEYVNAVQFRCGLTTPTVVMTLRGKASRITSNCHAQQRSLRGRSNEGPGRS